MVATGLLHAPVATQNLYGGALLHDPITARLFYASLAAGFLLLVAPCLTIMRIVRIHRRWWWLLCALGVAAMTTQSIAIAKSWAALTSSSTRSLLVEVVNKVNEKTLFDQCRIVVRTPLADIPDFRRLSDVMVKALASDKSGRLLRCVVVSADDVPTFAVVANDFCEDGGLSRIARLHPGVKPVSFANLCYQFFALPYVRVAPPLSKDVDIQ